MPVIYLDSEATLSFFSAFKFCDGKVMGLNHAFKGFLSLLHPKCRSLHADPASGHTWTQRRPGCLQPIVWLVDKSLGRSDRRRRWFSTWKIWKSDILVVLGESPEDISRTETCCFLRSPGGERCGDGIPCVGGCLGLLADFVETHLGCPAFRAESRP